MNTLLSFDDAFGTIAAARWFGWFNPFAEGDREGVRKW